MRQASALGSGDSGAGAGRRGGRAGTAGSRAGGEGGAAAGAGGGGAGMGGRGELVCLLALLGGMNLFLRRPLTGRRVVGIVLCFFVAIGAKEQGMLLPLLLLLLDRL